LPPAERDLDAIHWYVSRNSDAAADYLTDQLLSTATGLARFPHRHPTVFRRRVGGFPVRCQVCLNYRALFQVRGSSVFVLRFVHGSRRVPRRLLED
jgi:plasmid stabilization system protein ParE